ncbi:MAG: hypothetical protein HYY48_06960 [Gammaproteobacteria bacterium]|nr:hypothetical protein [Gammaproteobacteria bacterium]
MNKNGRTNSWVGALLFLFTAGAQAEGAGFSPLWEAAGFANPESVVHDPAENVLYVSNVNGDPAARDGNGFISKVSMDGQVLALEWLKGLNAPKGLAVVAAKLYTADIDTIIEIDTKTAAIANRYPVTDAKFMNDVAAGLDGAIYVSDTGANRIYRLLKGKLEIWLEDPALDSPNGLLIEKERILVGTLGDFQTKRPGQFLAVSMADKMISNVTGGGTIGVIDAVEPGPGGSYYLSDWPAGKILVVKGTGEVATLLEIKMGTADFDFIQASDMLVIPLMMDGKVTAYKGAGGGK